MLFLLFGENLSHIKQTRAHKYSEVLFASSLLGCLNRVTAPMVIKLSYSVQGEETEMHLPLALAA